MPPAPWILTGQAVAFLERGGARLLVNYATSPVGSYLECARATLPGPSVVEMLVTLEASKIGGREIWGFPKELALMEWENDQKRGNFRGKGQIWRFRAFGPVFPLASAFWTIQTLGNQKVRVPGAISGRGQLIFRGRQVGLWLREFEMKIEAPQL